MSTLRAMTARLPLQVAVERHHQRGVAFVRQQLEARQLGRVIDGAADDLGPALTSTSPGAVRRSSAAAGRGRRKFSTCRAAVVSSGAPFQRQARATRSLRRTTRSGRPLSRPIDALRSSSLGILQPHAAHIQRQRSQAVFQDVDRERALDVGPFGPVVIS